MRLRHLAAATVSYLSRTCQLVANVNFAKSSSMTHRQIEHFAELGTPTDMLDRSEFLDHLVGIEDGSSTVAIPISYLTVDGIHLSNSGSSALDGVMDFAVALQDTGVAPIGGADDEELGPWLLVSVIYHVSKPTYG